ncbi:hypothetical protein C7T94_11620 [Pedobacter yulinensis]|uniref:Activator of Hsp90 ATPase homologue 1/2-like C-terminal domain-containing protein n=1 Tax=Pedobacter yulinensis TaxID=2126353 RepID=A0A2T3HLB5_9SPHI|nr:SRPBCC family protein [Pedobacter yulinensis]PST83235.1 hypothetical protein C7T94_11620 [Pedobacter yulinensis]
MNKSETNREAVFLLNYVFNAPAEAVFNAFADADALNAWWGPEETDNTVISLDFRPGGQFRFVMVHDGGTNYGRLLFGKIEPFRLLEFSNAFTDEAGNLIDAPFGFPLPREIQYSLIFTEDGERTQITMTGTPLTTNTAELDGFVSIEESMQQGFGASFRQLAAYLADRATAQ